MTESRHTPLPWDVFAMGEIVGGGKGHLQRVVRTDWEHAPEAEIPEREANAALIVRAVNSHAEMLVVLKEWLPIVERQLDNVVAVAPPNQYEEVRQTTAYRTAAARVERLRAAIVAAEASGTGGLR